jgi:hypothetical protein
MVSNKSLATGIWYAEAAHACGLRSSEWAGHVKMAMLLQVGIIADRLYPKMHDDDVEYEAHADALQRAWDAQDAAEAEGKNAAPADCKKHLDASDTMALLDKYGDLK